MTETADKKTYPGIPGVCIPWDEQVKKMGTIMGKEEIIKSEWEKLEAFAYVYLWWWVQR
ncbi:hypothetical protein [Candidatus Formimonas warabiya]|uniref:hypothetical protein n=1 Tax=Formimonas warabiya TaxID=1761012 RepID=UPI001BE48E90|nr:hypothetical protein [Candidatus Formimonas warabiya]